MVRGWDNHAHLHKDHKVKPALEVNSDIFVWKGKIKEIGFYLWDYVCQKEWNGHSYNAKLRWDWAKDIPGRTGEQVAVDPLDHEFAILRQQPSGNVIYLMAHVESDEPPPPMRKLQCG